MPGCRKALRIALAVAAFLVTLGLKAQSEVRRPDRKAFMERVAKLETELTARYGAGQRERLARGLRQVSEFWRPGDGGPEAFDSFGIGLGASRSRFELPSAF